MAKKSFQLKIDEELRKSLKRRSIDEGRTMNEIIIRLIEKYLKKSRKK